MESPSSNKNKQEQRLEPEDRQLGWSETRVRTGIIKSYRYFDESIIHIIGNLVTEETKFTLRNYTNQITNIFKLPDRYKNLRESLGIFSGIDRTAIKFVEAFELERSTRNIVAFEMVARIIGYKKVLALFKFTSQLYANSTEENPNEDFVNSVRDYLDKLKDGDNKNDEGLVFLKELVNSTSETNLIKLDLANTINDNLAKLTVSQEDLNKTNEKLRKTTVFQPLQQTLILKSLDIHKSEQIAPIINHKSQKELLYKERGEKVSQLLADRKNLKKSINNLFDYHLSQFDEFNPIPIEASSAINTELNHIRNLSQSSNLVNLSSNPSVQEILNYLRILVNFEINKRNTKNLGQIIKLSKSLADALNIYTAFNANIGLLKRDGAYSDPNYKRDSLILFKHSQINDLHYAVKNRKEAYRELNIQHKDVKNRIIERNRIDIKRKDFSRSSLGIITQIYDYYIYSKKASRYGEDLLTELEFITEVDKYFNGQYEYLKKNGLSEKYRHVLKDIKRKGNLQNYIGALELFKEMENGMDHNYDSEDFQRNLDLTLKQIHDDLEMESKFLNDRLLLKTKNVADKTRDLACSAALATITAGGLATILSGYFFVGASVNIANEHVEKFMEENQELIDKIIPDDAELPDQKPLVAIWLGDTPDSSTEKDREEGESDKKDQSKDNYTNKFPEISNIKDFKPQPSKDPFNGSSSNKERGGRLIMHSHTYKDSPQPNFHISNADVDLIKNKIEEISVFSEYENGLSIPIIEKSDNFNLEKILVENPTEFDDSESYFEDIESDLFVMYSKGTMIDTGEFYKLPTPVGYKPKYLFADDTNNRLDPRIVDTVENTDLGGYTILIPKNQIDLLGPVIGVGYLKDETQKNPSIDVFDKIGDNIDVGSFNYENREEIRNTIEQLFEINPSYSENIENEPQISAELKKLKDQVQSLSTSYLNKEINDKQFAIELSNFMNYETKYEFNEGITDYNDIKRSVKETIEQLNQGGIICNQSSILMAYILEVHGIETSLKAIIKNQDNNILETGNQISTSNYHALLQIKSNDGYIIELDPTAFTAKNKNDNFLYISLGAAILGGGGLIYWRKRKKKEKKDNLEKLEEHNQLEVATENNENKTSSEQNSFRENWRDGSIESNFLRVCILDPEIIDTLEEIDDEGITIYNSHKLYSSLTKKADKYKIFNQTTQIQNYSKDNIVIPRGYLLEDGLMSGGVNGLPAFTEIPEINNEEYLIEKLLHAIDDIIQKIKNDELKIPRVLIDFVYDKPETFFERLRKLLNPE